MMLLKRSTTVACASVCLFYYLWADSGHRAVASGPGGRGLCLYTKLLSLSLQMQQVVNGAAMMLFRRLGK